MRPPDLRSDPLSQPARGQGHGGIVVPTEHGVISTHEWRLDQLKKVRQPDPQVPLMADVASGLGLRHSEEVHGGSYVVQLNHTGAAVVVGAGATATLSTATVGVIYTSRTPEDGYGSDPAPWAVYEAGEKAIRLIESGLYRVSFTWNFSVRTSTTGVFRVRLGGSDEAQAPLLQTYLPATAPIAELWSATEVVRSGYTNDGGYLDHVRVRMPDFFNLTNATVTIAAGFDLYVEQLGFWEVNPPEATPPCE